MGKPTTDRAAITAILKHMQEGGWTITTVFDMDDEFETNNKVSVAVGHVLDVDTAYVNMTKPAEGETLHGYIWFVLGNDPEEVACDYTMNLDPHLSELTDPWMD